MKEYRSGFVWNTISGMLSAGQSAVVLIFITRFLGVADAGIFSIAYAVANLMFVAARYGERNFQVTDIEEKYSFSSYFWSRLFSTIVSIFILVGYLALFICRGTYTFSKAIIIFLVCVWILISAVEDVFWGLYQQQGRLDVAGRCWTIRLALSLMIYCGAIGHGLSLITSTIITIVVSMVVSFLMIHRTFSEFNRKIVKPQISEVMNLLITCFPLFVGTTLSNYIGNIPKYFIDWYMDDTAQAYFGYIMMPAFLILILSNFIYQPTVRTLGLLWGNGETKVFKKRVFLQYAIVLGMTFLALIAGWIVGIPALSWIYGVDLADYKTEFMIILLGGGVYALVSFITVALTVVRYQKCVAIGFSIALIACMIFGTDFVIQYGIMGASKLYLTLNTVLLIAFTGCLIYKIKNCQI